MLSNVLLVGFFLCCPFSSMVGGQDQAVVVTDASPTEFPYVVRIHLFNTGSPDELTYPGLVVSGKFVLVTFPAAIFSYYNYFTITDQFGVVRTSVKNGSIVNDQFTYFKVCRKFGGATYPLRESDFNDLTTAVPDAHLIFFNKTSPVLRKVTVPVMSKTDCATARGTTIEALTDICVDSSGFSNIMCQIFYSEDYTATWMPLLAIGGQVQGLPNPITVGCIGPIWPSASIAVYRQNLTAELPVVDIV